MRKSHLAAVGVCLSFLVTISDAKARYEAKRVEFGSYTVEDYRPIVARTFDASPVRVEAWLALPKEASPSNKAPAVVIIPGSSGVTGQAYEFTLARNPRSATAALLEAGIATLLVDSFKGRGTSETGSDQGRVPVPAQVIDAFMALRFREGVPEIDRSKIGITGFSRGGNIALFTHYDQLRQGILGDDPGFAAHLPIYPSCATTFRNPRVTRAPLRILAGELDDYTPKEPCIDYIGRIKEQLPSAEAVVLPGAHHGWIASDTPPRKYSRVPHYRDCLLYIEDDGLIVHDPTGISTALDWRSYATALLRACGGYGVTIGGSDDLRLRTRDEIVSFFVATLKRQ